LCAHLAGGSDRRTFSVAWNGTILEQSQIITTHNLATLFNALDLRAALGPGLGDLATRCFQWVCRSFPRPGDLLRLRRIKNCAYAWRQMVFFLSLAEPADVERFFDQAAEYLGKRPPSKAAPLLEALLQCHRASPDRPSDVTPFLGWTVGKHPLLD
jgi:hypothetical protein